MADDLKTKVMNHRDEFNEMLQGARSGVIRRPIHLTFDDNDDEIILVGERELEIEEVNKRPMRSARQGKSCFG